jgi:hypothetical protein
MIDTLEHWYVATTWSHLIVGQAMSVRLMYDNLPKPDSNADFLWFDGRLWWRAKQAEWVLIDYLVPIQGSVI